MREEGTWARVVRRRAGTGPSTGRRLARPGTSPSEAGRQTAPQVVLQVAMLVLWVATAAWLPPVSAQAQAPVEIIFWTTASSLYADWIDRFEAIHPGIDVKAEYMGNYDEMAMKVQAAIAGRATPDLAQMGQRHGLPQVVDSGALVPVDEYLSPQEIDDLLPGLRDRYTYRGRLWAVPFGSSTPGLWYNRTAFREAGLDPDRPPQTWDELIQAAQALTRDLDGDGRIDQWGFGSCADVPWYVRPMILQAGGSLFAEDGRPTVDSPEAARVLRFFQDVVHRYRVSPPLAHQTAEQDFINGRYALLFCSTSVRAYYEQQVGDRFELGVTSLPADEERAVGVGGNGLVLFRSTPEREEAAAELIRFLTSPEMTAEMAVTTGYVAVSRSGRAQPQVQELLATNPRAQVIYDALADVRDAGIHPADALLWQGLLNAVERVQTDPSADPEQLLRALQRDLEQYMAGY